MSNLFESRRRAEQLRREYADIFAMQRYWRYWRYCKAEGILDRGLPSTDWLETLCYTEAQEAFFLPYELEMLEEIENHV